MGFCVMTTRTSDDTLAIKLLDVFTNRLVSIARSHGSDTADWLTTTGAIWEHFARRSDVEWLLRPEVVEGVAESLARSPAYARPPAGNARDTLPLRERMRIASARVAESLDLLRRSGFIEQRRTTVDFLRVAKPRPRSGGSSADRIDSRWWLGGESLGVARVHRPPEGDEGARIRDGKPPMPTLDAAARESLDSAFWALRGVRSAHLELLRYRRGRPRRGEVDPPAAWDATAGSFVGLLAEGVIDLVPSRLEYRWTVPDGDLQAIRQAGLAVLTARERLSYELALAWPPERTDGAGYASRLTADRLERRTRWAELRMTTDPLAAWAVATLVWGGQAPREEIPPWATGSAPLGRLRSMPNAADRFTLVSFTIADLLG